MEHISYGHINLNGKYSFKLFFSANNTTIALTTSGWRTILDQSGITLTVNEYTRTAILRIYLTNKTFSNTNVYWLTANGNLSQSAKPVIISDEKYRPLTPTVVLNIHGRTNISGLVYNTSSEDNVAGSITFIRDPTGTTNIHAYAIWGF